MLVNRAGRALSADEMIGSYGQDREPGLLSEHVEHFREAGGEVVGATARTPEGRVYSVVCSEIVWIDTEDGRIDGRCGRPITRRNDDGRCTRHG